MARNKTGIETRERIIDATRRLLAEVGLEGATIQAICEAADVRPGSFYNLFPSKDAAILTVVKEAARASDVRSPDGTPEVGAMIEGFVNFISEYPEEARVYLRIAVSGALSDEATQAWLREFHDSRTERLTRAVLDSRPDLAHDDAANKAKLLLATLNGLAIHTLLDPRFDIRVHADQLKKIVALV